MFPRRYFCAAFFAPRYFPQSGGAVIVVVPDEGVVLRSVGRTQVVSSRHRHQVVPSAHRHQVIGVARA